jgi:uncharacterized repeat protein (TIGR03803 family)
MRTSTSAICALIAASWLLAGCGGGSSPVSPSAPSIGAGGAAPAHATETVLHKFKGGNDGYYPIAALLAESGQFYGTTANGGRGGRGTVFQISSTGAKSTLYAFGTRGSGDGSNPYAGVIAGAAGALYGDTVNGGSAACNAGGCGAVYELVPSGSRYIEKVIYAFHGGNDGEYPFGGLLSDQSGALYGTTIAGGGAAACSNPSYTGGCGTVFKLTPSGSGFTESTLYSFQGGNDGSYPVATLIADATGALYGTTKYGGGSCIPPSGGSGCGTVFKLTPSGSGYSETLLYRFQGGTDGAVPGSALLAGSNGTLFGTTERGGTRGPHTDHGVVYELVPSESGYSEHVIFTFDAGNGAFPQDENGLYADGNGNLYGTAELGGRCCGVVFKLTPSGSRFSEETYYSFPKDMHGGNEPIGSLVGDPSGTLYGTTRYGGLTRKNDGTVFKLTP